MMWLGLSTTEAHQWYKIRISIRVLHKCNKQTQVGLLGQQIIVKQKAPKVPCRFYRNHFKLVAKIQKQRC